MKRIYFNTTSTPKQVTSRASVREFGDLQDDIVPVFSGKTGLALLLSYFRHTKQLEDKTAEVLVPPWMGQWVYMTMHTQCFPTREFNSRVRGVLVYHQWGFPQRMEAILHFAKGKHLFIIEDCAHAFEGYYRGKRLGTFGDAAIFSLAKFFPCVVGGALYTHKAPIREFLREHVKKAGPLEQKMFKERERYDLGFAAASGAIAQQYAVYPMLQGCVQKALDITRQAIAGGALQKRKEHSLRLRKEFDPRDRFGLFEDDVVPWVMPLFFEKGKMVRIAHALEKRGIESGVFHFDVNRTMLDPDYRECIALPCHDGITSEQMEGIIRTVRDSE